MRNVIYAINLTLDGCCDHTKFNPPDDDEVLEHYTHLLRDFDLLVYGRKTYQLMVPYWPDIAKSQSETKADIEFAQTFVSKKKIVFSRSLASAEDENTRIVRTNLRDEILKLKQEQGKNILVGGVDVPSQLMELGLIDDYRFVIMPTIVGEGRRLMEGVSLPEKLQLKLIESKPFKSGCVALRYLEAYSWTGEKLFFSLSTGVDARRMFCFSQSGRFDSADFFSRLCPWLMFERSENRDRELPREGVGCWNPVFPARADDVWLLVSLALSTVEQIASQSPSSSDFVVFERVVSEGRTVGDGQSRLLRKRGCDEVTVIGNESAKLIVTVPPHVEEDQSHLGNCADTLNAPNRR